MIKKGKIYIVDDDKEDRFLLSEAIQEADLDAEIIELSDGSELISLIESSKDSLNISLLVVDMNMPKMNGLETIAALRSRPGFSATPAVMLSTTSDPSLIQSAYNLGITHFATKPNSYNELKTLIRFLIRKFVASH